MKGRLGSPDIDKRTVSEHASLYGMHERIISILHGELWPEKMTHHPGFREVTLVGWNV